MSANGGRKVLAPDIGSAPSQLLQIGYTAWSNISPVAHITRGFDAAPLCLLVLFPSPKADLNKVVSEAGTFYTDPDRRIIKSINAEPATREYARIVGKDPEQLDRFCFASHLVVVRIGDPHHVWAIQQGNDTGELVFFAAIDEGNVMPVAKPQNMVNHLRHKMAALSQNGRPAHILGCDSILRRTKAEQTQMSYDLSDIIPVHNVTGFSTYGEQIDPVHVVHHEWCGDLRYG